MMPEDFKVGDKLKYIVRMLDHFWYLELIANAKTHLKLGEIYTISAINIASSWTRIKLKETGDLEYNLHWFENV